MKKIMVGIGVSLMLVVAGCGASDSAAGESKEKTESKSKTLAEGDFAKMYSNPKSYKGYNVEFTGQVFVEPEKDDDGTYLQIYANPEDAEWNTIVAINDPGLEVKTNDYVVVKGKVKDEFEGENLMGGSMVLPAIEAGSVEVVDYVTAVAPTLKEVKVDQTQDQHGLKLTVQKVEMAENQTRVYVKAENGTTESASVYPFNIKLLVGDQQLEEDSVYDTGLPELQSELLPGVKSEGVIIYKAVDPGTKDMKIHAEASNENYDLDWKPFVFDVKAE